MIQFTANEMAKMLKGTVEGDGEVKVWKPSRIEECSEGSITFFANPKYAEYFYEGKASVVIVDRKFQAEKPVTSTLIRVDSPYMAVAKVLHIFNKANPPRKGRSRKSTVGRHSKIGKGCYIGEYAVIGRNVEIGEGVMIYPQVYVGDNVKIGSGTVLYAGVKIYNDTEIGRNCILHSGAVIGADGFGFVPSAEGVYSKIEQIGNVVIEDDVEIGANSCVDRATMGSTIVRRGVKIDNLCQVAHNVQVGEHTVMCSQSGIAGSAQVGSHCILAGQSGVVGHIKVGNDVTIGAQAGVTNSVPDGATLLGSPAMDGGKQKRNFAVMRNMESLLKRIMTLEKKMEEKENRD